MSLAELILRLSECAMVQGWLQIKATFWAAVLVIAKAIYRIAANVRSWIFKAKFAVHRLKLRLQFRALRFDMRSHPERYRP